ncbi:MAG: hypothetical protein LBK25_06090 [Treponema sp.]|nr:hypothetical protein [Treponema sp.]
MRLKRNTLFFCFWLSFQPLVSQAQSASSQAEPIESVIGMTAAEVFSQFGAPQTVYAVRGMESWQDDIVFAYKDFDCYVYQDHVWQISVKSALGINIGDSRDVADLVLNDAAIVFDDCMIAPLPSKDWPLVIRVNFNDKGKIIALFIYRPDM